MLIHIVLLGLVLVVLVCLVATHVVAATPLPRVRAKVPVLVDAHVARARVEVHAAADLRGVERLLARVEVLALLRKCARNGILKKPAPTRVANAATPALLLGFRVTGTRGTRGTRAVITGMWRRRSVSFRAAVAVALLALVLVSTGLLFSVPLSPTPRNSIADHHSADIATPQDLPCIIRASSAFSAMALALPKHRALAAVVGGFVADAASMGLHWIYDPDKMKELVSAAPHPEFHEPPACPFYQYESGVLSPYGDEVLPLLEDVATRGAFVPEEFALVSYRAAKAYKGRLNHVFRELVTKGDAGATYPNLATESKDLHGGIKVPVLVAKYLDDVSTLVAKTKEATKVHQIGDEAEEAAVASALLLHQIVHGVSIREAVASLTTNDQVGSTTRATVQEVLDAVAKKEFADATAAIDKYGKSCGLPGVLKGSLFVLLTSNGYVDAVRANMVAGGDNCSRSILIGACAAAAAVTEGAMDPVPAEWKHKTKSYTQVQAFAERLLT